MSVCSVLRSFCKIDRGEGGLVLFRVWGGTVVSNTKFQVFMSIHSLMRRFCKIDRGGGGAGGDG